MKEIPPKSDSANTQYQKTIKAKQRRLVFIEKESSKLIRGVLSTHAPINITKVLYVHVILL